MPEIPNRLRESVGVGVCVCRVRRGFDREKKAWSCFVSVTCWNAGLSVKWIGSINFVIHLCSSMTHNRLITFNVMLKAVMANYTVLYT